MEPKTPEGPHSSVPNEDFVAAVNPSAAAPIQVNASAVELLVENNVNVNKKQVESPADQISVAQVESEASPSSIHSVAHKDLISSLQTQIEYYFSEENLRKDDYLKSQQDEGKWVKSALIKNFPRMHQKMLHLSSELKEELFKAAIAASPYIEFDEENDKIRAMPESSKPNGNKASNQRYCVILRDLSDTVTKQLLEAFLTGVDCSNYQSIAKLSPEMWELEFSTIEDSQNAHQILNNTNQKFMNKEISAFAKVKSNHTSKTPHSTVAARIDHVAAPIPQFSRFPYLAPTIPVTNQQPHPQLSLVSAPGGRLSGQQVQNNSVTSPHAVHNPAAIHPQQLIYLPPQTLYPPVYKVPPPAVPTPQQPTHMASQTSTAPAVPQQQVVAQQPPSSVQATAPSTSSRSSTSNYNPRIQDSRRTLVQPPTTGHQRVSYVYDNSAVMAPHYMSPEIYYDPSNSVAALPPQFVQPQLIQSRPSETPYPFLQAAAYMPSTVPPPGPTSSHNPGVQNNQPQVGNQAQTGQIPNNQRYSNNRMNNNRQSGSNNHQSRGRNQRSYYNSQGRFNDKGHTSQMYPQHPTYSNQMHYSSVPTYPVSSYQQLQFNQQLGGYPAVSSGTGPDGDNYNEYQSDRKIQMNDDKSQKYHPSRRTNSQVLSKSGSHGSTGMNSRNNYHPVPSYFDNNRRNMVASNDRNRRRFNQRGNNRRQDDDRNQQVHSHHTQQHIRVNQVQGSGKPPSAQSYLDSFPPLSGDQPQSIQLINPVVEGRPATADVVKGKEHAPVLQLASNNSLQNRPLEIAANVITVSDKKPALKSDKKVEDKKPVTTSFVNQNESIQLSTEVQMEEKEEKSIATKNVNDNKSAKVAVSKVQPKKLPPTAILPSAGTINCSVSSTLDIVQSSSTTLKPASSALLPTPTTVHPQSSYAVHQNTSIRKDNSNKNHTTQSNRGSIMSTSTNRNEVGQSGWHEARSSGQQDRNKRTYANNDNHRGKKTGPISGSNGNTNGPKGGHSRRNDYNGPRGQRNEKFNKNKTPDHTKAAKEESKPPAQLPFVSGPPPATQTSTANDTSDKKPTYADMARKKNQSEAASVVTVANGEIPTNGKSISKNEGVQQVHESSQATEMVESVKAKEQGKKVELASSKPQTPGSDKSDSLQKGLKNLNINKSYNVKPAAVEPPASQQASVQTISKKKTDVISKNDSSFQNGHFKSAGGHNESGRRGKLEMTGNRDFRRNLKGGNFNAASGNSLPNGGGGVANNRSLKGIRSSNRGKSFRSNAPSLKVAEADNAPVPNR